MGETQSRWESRVLYAVEFQVWWRIVIRHVKLSGILQVSIYLCVINDFSQKKTPIMGRDERQTCHDVLCMYLEFVFQYHNSLSTAQRFLFLCAGAIRTENNSGRDEIGNVTSMLNEKVVFSLLGYHTTCIHFMISLVFILSAAAGWRTAQANTFFFVENK